MSLIVPLAMIPAGIAATLLGQEVSRGLSLIGGDLVARAMGALLLMGGTSVLIGTMKASTLGEAIGLTCIAAGTFIYAVGVVLGLGLHGIVAGSMSMGIAIASAARVNTLMALARHLSEGNRDGEGPSHA